MASAPSKSIPFSVHKNTRDRQNRREVKEHMRGAVAHAHKTMDVAGYALVVWEEDGAALAQWFGGPFPSAVIPALTSETIRRTVADMDVEKMLNPRPEDA